jgi:hypothetical protein
LLLSIAEKRKGRKKAMSKYNALWKYVQGILGSVAYANVDNQKFIEFWTDCLALYMDRNIKCKPTNLCMIIFMLCLSVRFVEYFLIETDKTAIGENVLHKVVGIGDFYSAGQSRTCGKNPLSFQRKLDFFKKARYAIDEKLGNNDCKFPAKGESQCKILSGVTTI